MPRSTIPACAPSRPTTPTGSSGGVLACSLLIAIKASVDRDQRAGRFLVTGSSQLSANREVSETLAGRIERRDPVAAGGFPEALSRQGRRRQAWFSADVQTVIEREAPGISASPRTGDLPRLLRLIAARQASAPMSTR